MAERAPLVVVIAGPNGAGKSTTAQRLLQGVLAVSEFVNADTVAQGLSAFRPESAGLAAGRVMLARLKWLAKARVDFAFETTLASRSFAPWLTELKGTGYAVHRFSCGSRRRNWPCSVSPNVSRSADTTCHRQPYGAGIVLASAISLHSTGLWR